MISLRTLGRGELRVSGTPSPSSPAINANDPITSIDNPGLLSSYYSKKSNISLLSCNRLCSIKVAIAVTLLEGVQFNFVLLTSNITIGAIMPPNRASTLHNAIPRFL